MKKWSTSFLIQILCWQLALGSQVAYAGQGQNHVVSVVSTEQLLKSLKDFRFKVVGGEKEKQCEQEVIEEIDNNDEKSNEWKTYLKAVSQTKVPEKKKNGEEGNKKADCEPELIPGHLSKLIDSVVKEEEENKGELKVAKISFDSTKLNAFKQQATSLKDLTFASLDDSSSSIEEKRNIVLQYIDSVVMSMRDYVIALESYVVNEENVNLRSFYNGLLIDIPKFLFVGPGGKTFESQLQDGLSASTSPFYLKVEHPKFFFGMTSLSFDHGKILQRDAMTLLKAPTTLNYVKALKWTTLQMMMTQAQLYDTANGKTDDIKIPNSCQLSANGSLPESISNSYTVKNGTEMINGILLNNKMVFDQNDELFKDFYLYSVNNNPMQDYYSGLMPFENYQMAMQSLKRTEDRYEQSDIDDRTHYDAIIDMKMNWALSKFSSQRRYLFGLMDFEDVQFNGAELFSSFFASPEASKEYAFVDSEGKTVAIDTEETELSLYIVQLMQRHKVDDWSLLISDGLESHLRSHRILIDFPAFYSSATQKRWALKLFEKWFKAQQGKELSWEEKQVLTKNCSYGNEKMVSFCQKPKDVKFIMNSILDYLAKSKNADEFIPTRNDNGGINLTTYNVIKRMWHGFRSLHSKTGNFSIALTNEFDYLFSQFDASNPWAKARLSYLLALDELGAIHEGVLPDYSLVSEQEKQESRFVMRFAKRGSKKIIKRLNAAAKVIGINTVLHPSYGNHILSNKEKNMVWQDAIDGPNVSELFSFKEGDDYAYRKLQEVSAKTFLSRSDVTNFVRNHLDGELDKETEDIIDEILDSEIAQQSDLMKQIYMAKGNVEKQKEIYRQFAQRFGIDSSFKVKLNFLWVDNTIKTQIYRSLLRSIAKKRKDKIMTTMDTLCSFAVTDFESLKALYFSTVKQQNKLNEITGGNGISEEVLKKIEKKLKGVSLEERSEIKLGLMLMGATIGAMALAGSCVATIGATCGAAMILAGSAMGLQVEFARKQWKRYRGAKKHTRQMQGLEELGFTTKDSMGEVDRGWGWFAFEAVSIIPLIGILGRTTNLTVKSSSLLTTARMSGATSMKSLIKTGVREVEANSALNVLEFESVGKQTRNLLQNSGALLAQAKRGDIYVTQEHVKKIKRLREAHQRGRISTKNFLKGVERYVTKSKASHAPSHKVDFEYAGQVIIKQSVQEINEQTAKVVSKYLNKNPKALRHLLETYERKLPGAKKSMEKATANKTKFWHNPLKYGRNGIRSMRSKHLDEYSEVIGKLAKGARDLERRGGDLEDFVLKNVDDLTDVFINIPASGLGEFGYMFLAQGGKHLGRGAVSWSRYGSRMANGLVMRKFFNARSILVVESSKRTARIKLGLKKSIVEYSTFEVFQQFNNVVSRSIKNGDKESSDLYRKFKKDIVRTVMKESSIEAKFKKKAMIERVLFNPTTDYDRAQAHVVWNSVKPEKLFSLDSVQATAHRLVQMPYNSVDGFAHQALNALKVLMLKKDAGRIEII